MLCKPIGRLGHSLDVERAADTAPRRLHNCCRSSIRSSGACGRGNPADYQSCSKAAFGAAGHHAIEWRCRSRIAIRSTTPERGKCSVNVSLARGGLGARFACAGELAVQALTGKLELHSLLSTGNAPHAATPAFLDSTANFKR